MKTEDGTPWKILGLSVDQDRTSNEPIRVLGIDLGTTNSTATEIVWNGHAGDPITVRTVDLEQETQQGMYTHVLVPSFVAVHEDRTIVGEGAKRLRGRGLRPYQSIFYECKNDIGTRRTYHRAPKGYQSASEIAGRVLKFIADNARSDGDRQFDRVVVTVPASFQAPQRTDTLKAAQLAGLRLEGGDLLDEPVAAFIDYIVTRGTDLLAALSEPKNLLIFDFGGGTCDVAVLRIERLGDSPNSRLLASTLSVSRYHRLGGGDIDAAIVHDVLIPQLRAQNNLTAYGLSFTEKKNSIEPALLGVAEQLKIGLCGEIRRLQGHGKYDESDKSEVSKTAPGRHECRVGERSFVLQSPKLTAAQFETLLAPFLDHDLLFPRETEYRTTCSVFAPISDALERCDLEPRQIDFCLMAGGSSLIPPLVDAFDGFFPAAQVLTFPDRDSVKTCVSRGAAYHALSLAIQGRGFIQPLCPDDISVRTESGLRKLVPRGAVLPHPANDEWATCAVLGLPEPARAGSRLDLRLELVTEADERQLYAEIWDIPGPLAKGAPLRLDYRMDANQVLHMRMTLAEASTVAPFEDTIDKPLTNVVNPNAKRMKVLEIEEQLKAGGMAADKMILLMTELSDLYGELGQVEKAIDTLRAALQKKAGADGPILNKLGILCGRLGDVEREEKFYRESAAAWRDGAPLFNLALSLQRRTKTAEAINVLDEAMSRDKSAPYFVLRASLADDFHDLGAKQAFLEQGMGMFGELNGLSDWELGWLITGAQKSCDERLVQAAQAERRRRQKKESESDVGGVLPLELDGQEG